MKPALSSTIKEILSWRTERRMFPPDIPYLKRISARTILISDGNGVRNITVRNLNGLKYFQYSNYSIPLWSEL